MLKTKKKTKTDRQKAISRLDVLFSEYIRKRAMKLVNGCQRCEKGKTTWKQLDCAHNHSRNKHSVRWHELNAAGLCGGCHRYIDDNAEAKVEFFKNLIGEEDYEKLRIEAEMASKHSTSDLKLIELYLRGKIKELEQGGIFALKNTVAIHMD